jgi:chromosome segregation ATPase
MRHQFFSRIALGAAAVLALGCTESTTQEDVADAQQDVAEEQQDVDEARHEAMRPTYDEDAAEDIQEEQQDVAEAQADLDQTQRDFQATQARDAFALEMQAKLDEADRQIEALEARADGEEDAVAEATQAQINELKAHRDQLAEALDNLKSEDLARWQEHKTVVETAANELNEELTTVR